MIDVICDAEWIVSSVSASYEWVRSEANLCGIYSRIKTHMMLPDNIVDKLFKMHFVAKWQVAKSNAECSHLFQIIYSPCLQPPPPCGLHNNGSVAAEGGGSYWDRWMGRSSQWEIFVNEVNSCEGKTDWALTTWMCWNRLKMGEGGVTSWETLCSKLSDLRVRDMNSCYMDRGQAVKWSSASCRKRDQDESLAEQIWPAHVGWLIQFWEVLGMNEVNNSFQSRTEHTLWATFFFWRSIRVSFIEDCRFIKVTHWMFSVTRRSRSDESHWVTELLTE